MILGHSFSKLTWILQRRIKFLENWSRLLQFACGGVAQLSSFPQDQSSVKIKASFVSDDRVMRGHRLVMPFFHRVFGVDHASYANHREKKTDTGDSKFTKDSKIEQSDS